MRYRNLLLIGLIVSAVVLPLTAKDKEGIGLELGLSYTPSSYIRTAASTFIEDAQGIELGDMSDHIPGFHVGYSFWWLFHVSWDGLVMPPWWIYEQTSGLPGGSVYAPGYYNMFDAGIRLKIWVVYLLAEAGINTVYLHSSALEQIGGDTQNFMFGYNLQLGAGLKLSSLGVTAKIAKHFGSQEALIEEFRRFARIRSMDDIGYILESYIPYFVFNLHFD